MAHFNLITDLIETCASPGCAVCRLVDRDVRQYIDSFFYESITVVERRAEIRAARGFCSVHGSILAGHSRTLGTAIIHHDVVNDVLRGFPEGGANGGAKGGVFRAAWSSARDAVARALRPRRECVLCDHERHQERILLEALINGLPDDKIRAAFEQSGGLCFPHLQAALQLRDIRADNLRLMIDLERRMLSGLRDELATFIHKSNGSYEFTAMGAESDSPARATKLVSGRVFGRRAY